MHPLEWILWIKIIATLLLWALPLLVIPSEQARKWGLPVIDPPIFGRLLGVAYCALLAGYISGLVALRQGSWPTGIIWMGIISNGGASVLLFHAWILGQWKELRSLTRGFQIFSMLLVMAITTGLVTFGLFGSAS